jgi:hypothetical protein
MAVPAGPGRHPQAEAARAWLTREILAPVLNGRRYERLVFVVSGSLERTPFAALADPYSTPPGKPLGITREIVYTPSASIAVALRRALSERSSPPFRLAVLADPAFGDPRWARLLHRYQVTQVIQGCTVAGPGLRHVRTPAGEYDAV